MKQPYSRAKQNFSDAAQDYDDYAVFQRFAASEFAEFIMSHSAPGSEHRPMRILELGCGTGFLTRELSTWVPESQILATDVSPQMVAVAERKLSGMRNLSFMTLDFNESSSLKQLGEFDLIVSGMAFQWANSLDRLLQALKSPLKQTGKVFFSLPTQGTFRVLHHAFQLENAPYPGLIPPSIESVRATLRNHFARFVTEEHSYHEEFTSLSEFLHELQKMGTDNASGELVSPGTLRRMIISHPDVVDINYEYLFATCCN